MAVQQTRERNIPQPLPIHLELMSELTTPAVAAATTFQRRFFDNMTALQKEWYGFLQARWMENIAMPRRLSRCQTPMDVQQVYMDYWRRTLDQYSGEFQHLGEISQHEEYSVHSAPDSEPGMRKSAPVRPDGYAQH